jgi:hypothetical protein
MSRSRRNLFSAVRAFNKGHCITEGLLFETPKKNCRTAKTNQQLAGGGDPKRETQGYLIQPISRQLQADA